MQRLLPTGSPLAFDWFSSGQEGLTLPPDLPVPKRGIKEVSARIADQADCAHARLVRQFAPESPP